MPFSCKVIFNLLFSSWKSQEKNQWDILFMILFYFLDTFGMPGKQVAILVTMAAKGSNFKVFEAVTLRHLKRLQEQKFLNAFLKYLKNSSKNCHLMQPGHLKYSSSYSNLLICPSKFPIFYVY